MCSSLSPPIFINRIHIFIFHILFHISFLGLPFNKVDLQGALTKKITIKINNTLKNYNYKTLFIAVYIFTLNNIQKL